MSDNSPAPDDDLFANVPSDGWGLLTALQDGWPIIIRMNRGAACLAAHPALPFRMDITIRFLRPRDDGFPPDAERPALDAFEDTLLDALRSTGCGILIMVTTTAGLREFVGYVQHEEDAVEAVTAAARHINGQVELFVEPDPTWTVFDTYFEKFNP